MMIGYALATAILAILVAVAHFVLGERKILRPLFKEPGQGVMAAPMMRRLTWAMFQLHSLVWASIGIAVLINRWQDGGDLISQLAIIIFTISGLGNFAALRRAHPGGILLLMAAACSAADLWFN